MAIENVRGVARRDFGTVYPPETEVKDSKGGKNLLNDERAIARHSKLWGWFQEEKDRQAVNRFQMALDEDFYDGLQWSDEDAQALLDRGQAPLVFNMIHPTIEWLTGTERRTRMDWHVYPRGKADVEDANVKKHVLKFINDNNRVGFAQSQAFKDAVVAGLGWLEDSVRADPTEDPLYSGFESWRYVWHDSLGKQLDGSDWRYQYRKKNVDLDIAQAMFPQYASHLKAAALRADNWPEDDDENNWYLGTRLTAQIDEPLVLQRRTFASSWGWVSSDRERVPLVEAWYRMPARVQVMLGEQFHRETFDRKNEDHNHAVRAGYATLTDAVRMQVWCAIMTEGGLLQNMRSPYRHDRFPLTPLWCYRRARDGAPYGIVRNIRDPQEDLNKRASKSLHILSTKQLIADHDAFDDVDIEELREELAAPDGIIKLKKGAKYEVIQDKDVAEAHIKMEIRDREYIRESAGITGEQLGLETNAISGKAVIAKQQQGSLQTATPFDNKRLAVQIQGENQVSLMEQYYTEPKVIRLTESKERFDWLEINQPEVQPDGSIRYINDISQSKADFLVDEIDYKESVRAAMFESMMALLARFPPEMAVQVMDHVLELADMPNKEEFIADVRRMAGKPNPEAPRNEKEAKEAAAAQAEAQRMKALQQRGQELAVEEVAAKVNKLNAEAQKIAAEADAVGQEEGGEQDDSAVRALEDKCREIERRAAEEQAKMRHELQKAAVENANRQAEIDSKEKLEREKLDVERDKLEMERTKVDAENDRAALDAEHRVEIERIQAQADTVIDGLMDQLKEVREQLTEVTQQAKEAAAEVEKNLKGELEKRDAQTKAKEQAQDEADKARKEEQGKAERERKESEGKAEKERKEREAKEEQARKAQPASVQGAQTPQPVIGELHVHAGGGKRVGKLTKAPDGSMVMESGDIEDGKRKRRRFKFQKAKDGSLIAEELDEIQKPKK